MPSRLGRGTGGDGNGDGSEEEATRTGRKNKRATSRAGEGDGYSDDMSLLAGHGDENRDERERSTEGAGTASTAPAMYPQLVLGLSGHGNVNVNVNGHGNSSGHGNGHGNGNPNYRYNIELASRAKLSPISASGVFSRYNVFSPLNNSNSNSKDSKSTSKRGRSRRIAVTNGDSGGDSGDSSYRMPPTPSAASSSRSSSNTVEEVAAGYGDSKEGSSAPFKRFRNPFASSVVSSFGTLELSGVTKGSFTTISISTIETAEQDAGKYAAGVCRGSRNTTVRANAAQDERLDRILRIAKKMMGDELIEDLIASSTPTVRPQTHRQRRFGFPAVAPGSGGGTNDDKIESVGEFVETVIERELTFCSWTAELAIRQDFAGLDSFSLNHAVDNSLTSSLDGFSLGAFGTGVSTGTVVRYLHRHDPRQQHDGQRQLSLVDVLKPRKRDWFLRLFHWHHHHHHHHHQRL